MQMGYNLLYGLHKSSYDADCALFLAVLRGDVKEDVYIQTAHLQVPPHPPPPPLPPSSPDALLCTHALVTPECSGCGTCCLFRLHTRAKCRVWLRMDCELALKSVINVMTAGRRRRWHRLKFMRATWQVQSVYVVPFPKIFQASVAHGASPTED